VEEGSTFVIDYRDVKPGDTIELTKVLLVAKDDGATVGMPTVTGARVVAEVVDLPTKKTQAQSFRRRKASKRLRGHTQPYVRVRVKQIVS